MRSSFIKKMTVALIIGLALLVALPVATLASDPTVTTVTWNGGGVVGAVVTSGNDNVTSFGVNAGLANGTFIVTDNNDNPYTYGVDTVSGSINGSFSNGGSMVFQTNRTDSAVGSYGHAGQVDYAYVGSSGTGAMTTGSGTNYASMCNGIYGNPNFAASGSYTIQQFIAANTNGAGVPTDNYGTVTLSGSGTGALSCWFTEASGDAYRNGQTRLGWGGGCYTIATVAATGSGTYALQAGGSNSITTPVGSVNPLVVPGNGTFGSCTLSIIANFVGNFNIGPANTPGYATTIQ